ncbi:MAG: HEPN domain-containing protein [Campylobacterales bacterium]|nr:HEPN domain-containing protein [Campylobacterales bacterium]
MEFVKQYVVLYKKAKTDLRVAKILLDDFEKGDNELDLEVIMFHLQQCAEKLLKSLLAFNEHHFTKTHSIETLVDALNSCGIVTITEIEELIPLSDYAVEGRYAIIHDDLDDVGKYIKILDEFSNLVKLTIDK